MEVGLCDSSLGSPVFAISALYLSLVFFTETPSRTRQAFVRLAGQAVYV